MPNCAYCGQPVEPQNTKHTHEDCMNYLKDHPEGGVLFEKMGGLQNMGRTET